VFILWILPFNHIQTFYASSFQAGIYCKIHLQMINISAFHYFLTMVAVSTFSGQIGGTICRYSKEKGRAETLPFKMLIKSEIYSSPQLIPKYHQSFPSFVP